MTDAERKLWHRLRGEQPGVKFRRQHPFENYILDFVCLEKKLVVEVDGSQHAQAIAGDAARTTALERAGFRVLRFWNNEVLEETEAVLERIMQELKNPSPSCPSP
ncbi:MAG: endonuclease domain-containing protein [Pseudomonadota bacterium]